MLETAMQSSTFWLKIAQLFTCMFCFAMTSQYYESELFQFPLVGVKSVNGTGFFLLEYEFTRYGFVRINMISIATCGFTWLILPIIIICYLFEKQNLDKALLIPLFSAVGFLVYLVSGSLICHAFAGLPDAGAKAAGALCIMNGFFFLADAVYFQYKKTLAPPTESNA